LAKPASRPFRVIIGGSRDQRAAAVRDFHADWAGPKGPALHAPPLREIHVAAHWPFLRHVMPPIQPPTYPPGPGGAAMLWLRDLHLAFPPARAPGIRLVLTQSTYQLQRVLDRLETNPAYAAVADADDRIRPEISGRRGPWARIEIVDLGQSRQPAAASEGPPYEGAGAFAEIPSAAAALLLHRATEAIEQQEPEAAAALLEQAVSLDPSWEAAHFEMGKMWLRSEDTERAAAAFAEAGRLMPSFAAAFSNLGATLGELERGDEALAALEQALRFDPNGFPIINNIGAVHREAGRLDAAETAFRQVVDEAPSFVFGHYNLGHTLFLQGRFAESRDAYERGQQRDAQRNPRQACRLAVARAAAGDAGGAIRELELVAAAVPMEMMRGLAGEAEQALRALPPGLSVELAAVLAAVGRYRT
jgi:tetratricopeptide (TPR) repeat protein